MANPLYRHASSPQAQLRVTVKIRDLIHLLEDHGWELVRTKGSHLQDHHRDRPGVVTVAGHPRADMPPGTLAAIIRSAGLTKEDLA